MNFYESLISKTQAMLVVAQNKDWEYLLELEHERSSQIKQLATINDEIKPEVKEPLIRELLSINQKITAEVEKNKEEVSQLVIKLQQAAKKSKAYKEQN